jgi:hypothetical protein
LKFEYSKTTNIWILGDILNLSAATSSILGVFGICRSTVVESGRQDRDSALRKHHCEIDYQAPHKKSKSTQDETLDIPFDSSTMLVPNSLTIISANSLVVLSLNFIFRRFMCMKGFLLQTVKEVY